MAGSEDGKKWLGMMSETGAESVMPVMEGMWIVARVLWAVIKGLKGGFKQLNILQDCVFALGRLWRVYNKNKR